MALDENVELFATIDGRLLTSVKRLSCEPFRDEYGALRRRIKGALGGAGMMNEHSFFENAALCGMTVEVHAFLDPSGDRIVSQGQIAAVRLVFDGNDTVCEFEFVGNAKLPL